MPEITPLEAARLLEMDARDCMYISKIKINVAKRLAASYLRKIANGEYKQVVRCGECEYWQNDGVHIYGMCENPNIGNVKLDTDFCSYGERKDDTHE